MTQLLDRMSDDEVSRAVAADGEAGFGALATERGRLPLKAMDVRARIDGLLTQVTVRQTFVNPFPDPLEATYIFPLPDRAAVTSLRMEVAGRIIEAELKERGQARRDYDQAIRTGHRAAITEEERPGVFTMRLGNLPPGEEATVRLTLAGPLPYADGEATFRFPLVVAPRYIPGTPLPGSSVGAGVESDTDAVPDASRISPPVLLPGFPNPVRLALSVEVFPSSLPVTGLRSSLHAVEEQSAGSVRCVTLQPGARLDRDFILRLRLGEGRLHTSLSLQPDGPAAREGTFLLAVVPPVGQVAPRPRDVIFVLDRSGSMEGWKIVAARRAVARMIDTLLDQDRFTVLAFDDHIETPPDFGGLRLVHAIDRQRFRAVEFLAKVESRGGTEMAQPLDLAVKELSEAGPGRERVLVLITDGQVGNEDQILHTLARRLRGLRVFCLGIDRAVNAAFLNRLAALGGGSCELVESEDRLDEVMEHIHRRIAQPVLTRLKLEPAGLSFDPASFVPGRLPDVFPGCPLLILGRYRGLPDGGVALQAADVAGQPWSATVRATRSDNPALMTVWARGQVRKLEDLYLTRGDHATLERHIVETSLRFGVLSRFTAFVAVDRSEVVNPSGQVREVVQPVEHPEGWAQPTAGAAPRGTAPRPAGGVLRRKARSLGAAPPPPSSPGVKGPDVDEAEADRRCNRPARERGPQSPTPMTGPRKLGNIPPELMQGDKPLRIEDLLRPPTDAEADADDSEDRASRKKPSAEETLGRGSSSEKQSRREGRAAGSAPDRFRERALELLQLLHLNRGTDVPARWGILLHLLAGKLEALLRDLAGANVDSEEVRRLRTLLQKLQALQPAGTADDAMIGPLWNEAEASLRAFLNGGSAAAPQTQCEEFWK
jgi:Ca-activated chloride channel homolog